MAKNLDRGIARVYPKTGQKPDYSQMGGEGRLRSRFGLTDTVQKFGRNEKVIYPQKTKAQSIYPKGK